MSNQTYIEVSPNVQLRGGDRCVEVSPNVRMSAKLVAIQAAEGNSSKTPKEKEEEKEGEKVTNYGFL